ncbi:MAG: magnesium transporter MgtC [Geobacteraceae bacterium GWC2_58_44]|nr:MAG: magnesium transporter MgtC [Geobacteraceae bacterium GWC2_58_44]HBG06653.1 magnesium transporter MgtC [Geobacter sp.]
MGPEIDPSLLLRLLLASLLGGILGLEREIHGRPAGFRTHLLVSLGSCLFCISSVEFYRIFGNFSGMAPVGVDPGRIAAQVVAGIGFLGAGAIIRDKASIRGLTTAACLWVAAALGLACGIGLFYLSICVTAVALISLLLLKQVEKRLHRDRYVTVKVWGDDSEDFITRIYAALVSCGIDHMEAKFDKNVEQQMMFMEVQVKRAGRQGFADIIGRLSLLDGVKRVRID